MVMQPNKTPQGSHSGNHTALRMGAVRQFMAALFVVVAVTALVGVPVVSSFVSTPALAQAKKKKKQNSQQSNDQQGDDADAEQLQDNGLLPPLYDDRMMRLSELLGALHYLRTLCDSGEGQLWREEMNEMIAAEQPSKERKAKMIAQFNKGFRSYQEVYRECTPAATESSNRYLREGIKISTEISSRYGN